MGDVSIGDDLFRVIVHDVAVDVDRQVQLFSSFCKHRCGRSPRDLNIGHAPLSAVPEQKLLHQVQFFWFHFVLLSRHKERPTFFFTKNNRSTIIGISLANYM